VVKVALGCIVVIIAATHFARDFAFPAARTPKDFGRALSPTHHPALAPKRPTFDQHTPLDLVD
jgi:hypothetical protein